MSKLKPMPPEMEEWRRCVDFSFGGQEGLPVPDGFKDLTIDEEITVLVKGKVRSIRQDKENSGFSIIMSKLQIKTDGKESIDDTLDKIKNSRKKE